MGVQELLCLPPSNKTINDFAVVVFPLRELGSGFVVFTVQVVLEESGVKELTRTYVEDEINKGIELVLRARPRVTIDYRGGVFHVVLKELLSDGLSYNLILSNPSRMTITYGPDITCVSVGPETTPL